MEPEGLLRHSPVPATCPFLSQLDPVHAPSIILPEDRSVNPYPANVENMLRS